MPGKSAFEQRLQQRQHAERLPLLVADETDALARERVEARRMRLRDLDAPAGSWNSMRVIALLHESGNQRGNDSQTSTTPIQR